MIGWIDVDGKQMVGWKDKLMDWIDERMDKWMDGWMDGIINGRMDGWL